MAQIPTKETIKTIQEATKKAIEEKRESQLKEGKDFIPTKAGVLPEEEWQKHKVVS